MSRTPFHEILRFVARVNGRITLKGKLVTLTVGLFAVFIWALALFSATILQSQLEQVLSKEQFASTQRIAAELNNKLNERIDGLTNSARHLPTDLAHPALQDYLARQGVLQGYFSGGIAVVGLDGRTIADYPVAPGRRGAYFGDRDYFRSVVASEKSYIDKPIIGRALNRPVLTIAVPVFDGAGELRAVMTGITDLTAANFLGVVSDRSYTGNGEFFIFSLNDNMIVAATDSRRAMTAAPPRGANLLYDRMVDGFEGSGVAVSSEGIRKLYSGKRVPSANWLVLAALPTDVAFGPVTVMRQYLYAAAGVMTLLAILISHWMARGTLAPLDDAGRAMRQMTTGQTAFAELPVAHNDEVGQLIASFNLLVADRRCNEVALAESEQRFRMLVESAPDAVFVDMQGRFAYVNEAVVKLLGFTSKEQLLGRSVTSHVHPDCRAAMTERMRWLDQQHASLRAFELQYLRSDESMVEVEVSAVPFRYQNEDGALVFVRDITERKRADLAIRESERRYRFLFGHMLEGFAYCRMLFENGQPADFIYLEVNPAFEQLTGLKNVVGKRVSEVIPDIQESSPQLFTVYGRVASGGVPERFEIYVPPLAHWFWISVYSPEDECFVAVFDVITERKQSEQTQRRLNRALRLLSTCNGTLVHAEREQSLLDEICRLVVDTGGYRMAWVGYAESDPDNTVRPVSHACDDSGFVQTLKNSWGDNCCECGATGTAIRTGHLQVHTHILARHAHLPGDNAAAEPGCRSIIALPLKSEQGVFGALTIYSAEPDSFIDDEVKLLQELANDLSFGIETLRVRAQRAVAEEKLAFLAHHDPLTTLPNRLLLRDRFDQAIACADREGSGVALLFLDLDHFKQINDSLGHDVGDQLLVRVVERLRGCIRATDTVSRQGGDEFLLLLNDVSDSAVVSREAQDILDAITEPFEIGVNMLNTSASIGISVYPNDGTDFETLFKNADTALYHAKDSGRDTFRFFAPMMNVDALARMQLQNSLRHALKNQEFLLHYQPQIHIASGRVVGMEALLRWQRPGEGMTPPGAFIPAAEQSGQIIAIGEWVLNEACRQARAWQHEGFPPLVVAVNLSALQFKRGNILNTVARALERSGLAAQWLELELTESILLEDIETALEVLHGLKKMGVKLSIDDFGTGYSSLSYLRRLPVDKLKIDHSFMQNIAEDSGDSAIVRAIIDLGHTLQLVVIAEGVETDQQLDFLKIQGCDEVQGYLFGRPVSPVEFAKAVSILHERHDVARRAAFAHNTGER